MELNLNMKVSEMEYDRYIECMEILISKEMNKSIKVVTATKNNGYIKKGLWVDEEKSNMNPQIYLEEMYQEQREKEGTLKDSVDEFLRLYQISKHDSIPLDFFEWEHVKDHVTTKVINAEWNKELLKKIPHRRVLDLAIVYQIVLEMTDSGSATILIRKEHLESWGITEEELQKSAKENSEKLFPAELGRMYDIVCETMGIVGTETDEVEDSMYVLTNQYKMFGAVAIFYEGMLEKIAETLKADFVIIPSSVHEMVIIKDTYHQIDKEEIMKIIKQVNNECVRVEERLSDHSYYYSVANKQLSL